MSPPRPAPSSRRTSCAAGFTWDASCLAAAAQQAPLPVQAPSALHSAPEPRCKVGQLPVLFASDFSLPRFEVPLLPTLLPPGAACPGGLAVRSSVQSSPTMLFRSVLLAVQGKVWTRGLSPWGAFVTLSQSGSPGSPAGPSKGAYGQRLSSRLRPSPAQRLRTGPAVEAPGAGAAVAHPSPAPSWTPSSTSTR